jgi:serine phosphatase RsbU (regulator of sigma subunit)
VPSSRDWIALVKQTFHAVGREDLSRLWIADWPDARRKLTAEFEEEAARPGGRIRRFFRGANAVLFGLARRLAPARRVLFGLVLLLLLLSFQCRANFETQGGHGATHRTTEWGLYFDNGILFVAIVVLGLLLAMELVDKIAFRDELELARELQATLIPRDLPRPAGYALAAHNEIANMVGGDIYDFVPLSDGRLAVLFGDASGHGMAAGLVMAVAHAAFRTQLDVDPEPVALFAALNRILCRTGTPRAFFAGMYLLFTPDGAFAASIAGHPPARRIGRDGRLVGTIGRGAYPLGIKTDLTWLVERGRLEPGELLLLASDGVTEAQAPDGAEFGDARLDAAAARLAGLAPETIVEGIADEARRFRGGKVPEDDVSIAVVRYEATAG